MCLEFDTIAHRYKLDGVMIPHISFVLEQTGFIDKTWFKPEHAERGKAVHSACQFLIEGDLDWSTVHPEILPRVKGFEQFLIERKPTLILSEKPLASKEWRFSGTPDLVLEVPGDRVQWIVDLKSGASGIAAKLQTAAQEILVKEECGNGIYKRFVLELPKDGGYKLIPHDERMDKLMFLNALAMVHRRLNEGEIKL